MIKIPVLWTRPSISSVSRRPNLAANACPAGSGPGILSIFSKGSVRARANSRILTKLEQLGRCNQGRLTLRARPDRPQSGFDLPQIFPRRVLGTYRKQTLSGSGVPRSGRLSYHQGEVHRLPALRPGLPDRGDHRAPFRAA